MGGEGLTPLQRLSLQEGAQSPPSMAIPADSCFLLQAEIVKRLSAICAQIIPFLTQEVRRMQQIDLSLPKKPEPTPA